jgi:hypothetical protein
MADNGTDAAFRVSGFDHYLSGLIANYPRFWIGLGNLETKALADEIAPVAIEAPIYVTGLARAGTTIALEILAAHPDVASHLYRDFPPVFTPYWWNWFVEKSRKTAPEPQERTHKDGIMITPDSPEAREEVIWMAFFDALHDPGQSNLLDQRTTNPAFEPFYRDHIRKLLAARGRRRYLSKGNYNVTRIGYLHRLFPDIGRWNKCAAAAISNSGWISGQSTVATGRRSARFRNCGRPAKMSAAGRATGR